MSGLLKKGMHFLDQQTGRHNNPALFVLMYIATIAMLFVPFLYIYFSANKDNQNQLPKEFGLSTLLVMLSFHFIARAKVYKAKDLHKKFALTFLKIFVCGLCFLCYQLLGWKHLFNSLQSTQRNILLVLVGTHALHFIIALVLIAIAFAKSWRIKSSTDFYIFFLNVKSQLYYKITIWFWDFLTILWLILYACMLVK